MNHRSNTIQPINKPMNFQSFQDLLSQSIVQSVHNPTNSSIFTKNKNNNALPEIQTDMLASFNPEAYELKRQDTFRGRQMSQRSTFISPRFQSQSKVKVSFSYGNNYQQNFTRSPLTPSNFHSVHRSNQLTPTNMIVINRSSNLNVVRPHSSMESTKDYSNLSELSKQKRPFQTVISYPFGGFQKKENQLKKTHKLGRKSKPFQSFKREKMEQMKLIPTQVEKIKQSNETSFEVVQSPRKNISSISIDKSQYVFMSEKKKEQKINIEPETYVYSGTNLLPKSKFAQKPKPFGFNLAQDITSMILPIEEEQDSQMHMPILSEKTSNMSKTIKSPGKIDNKIYLQQQKPVSLSSMSMLRKLDSKQQGLSQDEQMNKFSKISKISHKHLKNQKQKSPYTQKAIVSPFAKLQQYQQIQTLQKKHKEQKKSLEQRILSLQDKLKSKQQQNINLRKKLQNTELQKQIQSQYQKLQMISKLNEIEIKKLRNQIKMFKIKEKLYQNKQKEQSQIVTSLKQEIKSLKNYTGIMSLTVKNKITGY